MTNLPSKMTERDLEQALENVLPIRADESALGFPVAQQGEDRPFPPLMIDQNGDSPTAGTWLIRSPAGKVSIGSSVTMVLVKTHRHRVPFWTNWKKDKKEEATCISWDGEHAAGYGPPEFHNQPPSMRDCMRCPAKNDGRCLPKYLLLAFVDVQGEWSPSVFLTKGSAVKPVMQAMAAAKTKAAETYDVKTGKLRRPAFLFSCKASIERRDGRYFAPVFGDPTPLDTEQALIVTKLISTPDIAQRWTDEIKHLHDKAMEILGGRPAEREPGDDTEPTSKVDYSNPPF